MHERALLDKEQMMTRSWWRAPEDPSERDRRPWLMAHGITPMNRSTRLWDMEITAHLLPHRTERVGSLDMARTALNQQRAGHKIDPIKWQGSQSMATGRAYDWCYCIEAVDTEADGRVSCICQCCDCKPPGKGATQVHWRKRKHAHDIRVGMIRHQQENNTRWIRLGRFIESLVWDYEHGYWFWQRWGWFADDSPVSQGGDTLHDDEVYEEPDTPHEPINWYKKKSDPEEDAESNGRP
jgi:hypothetical protein